MSIIFGTVEIPNMTEMPQTTTRKECSMKHDVDPELEAESDEEAFEDTLEFVNEDWTKIEVIMINVVVHSSLESTLTAGSNGASPSRINLNNDASGNKSQIDEATE